jgi:hypothetical protein
MSHATRHARHEQARKRHRKEVMSHTREAAKRPKERVAVWFLAVGVAAMVLTVAAATAVR